MLLSLLLQNIVTVPTQSDHDITGLTLDSRKSGAGNLFLAIKGTHSDGRHFIADAIARGASAVLVDADSEREAVTFEQGVILLPVLHLQRRLGEIAARFYDYPSRKLQIFGVTGTSGKTSCTHFIAQVLQSLDIPCGIIGTLGCGFYGALSETGLTTPDAVTLQATLHQFVQQGAQAVAMEVSSHSIEQGRINGIDFEAGVFTNLTQDHLDYHGDMETYASVKKRFLAEFPLRHLIINADDARGHTWIAELSQQREVRSYAASNPADIFTDDVSLTLHGIRARVHTPWGKGQLTLALIGQFNLSNALAALATLCSSGLPFKEVLDALTKLEPVPGRMQTLGKQGQPLVVVDYAHKPDALEKVLQALRSHTAGKLICVFGCGGERDRGKRPLMARIAEQLADQVIVTNDNPRHEKPEDIAAEIMHGFSRPERVLIELDRSKAIRNSIQCASGNDCILIAGKGAERYQQIGDEKLPFDDVEQVKNAFQL
jgi:UDP-N-acetylmuramoyl-L-alanyl-D-glutamate--2,6-diaminopimelate ligase